MKELLKDIGIGVAGVLVGLFIFSYIHPSTFGSSTGYNSLLLTPSSATGDTYALAVTVSGSATTVVDMNGNVVAVASSTSGNFNSLTIAGGTALTGYVCSTSSWNPPSIASSGAPSGGVLNASGTTVAGTWSIGSPVIVGLNSMTSTNLYSLTAYAVSATSVQATLVNNSAAAIDFGAGTVRACQLQ